MTEEQLSDRELRLELVSYGEKVGPITSTTRDVYIKRLKKVKKFMNEDFSSGSTSKFENHSKALKKVKQTKIRPKRKTFGFSSDESDNNEVEIGSKHQSSMTLRQRSMKHDKSSKSLPTTPSRKPIHKSVLGLMGKTNTSRKTLPVVTNGYSDDSDEDITEVMIADVSTSPLPSYNSTPVKSSLSPRRPLRKSWGSLDTTPSRIVSSTRNTTNGQKLSGTECNGGVELTDNVDISIRQRVLPQENSNHIASTENDENEPESKLPNVFVRLWNKIPASQSNVGNQHNGFVHAERSSQPWHLHCSALLPIGTVVFFVVLGLLYASLRSDEAIIHKPALPYQPSSTDIDKIMKVVHLIHHELATHAGEFTCNTHLTSDLLSVPHLKSVTKVENTEFLKALQLIQENPEWKLNLFASKDRKPLHGKSLTEVTHLSSDLPILPTICRFRRAVEKVLLRVGAVFSAGLFVWLVIAYRQYRTRKQAEERQTMFVLVEKILDLLKTHHEDSQKDETLKPFIPILHARDMIIQPQERRKMQRVWEKAVHFISASESRIRVENQRISGEDFLVWRWIQVTSPSKRQCPPGRVWQGEAFDTNRSINTPTISPTPCLKIRNMFDPDMERGDDWHFEIQDSILEKCSNNNEIISIVVEKKSNEGIVYMKCSSCAGAGSAYKSLHGTWFDGRLVTVKFIKLSRFHSHYPHTVSHTTPMKPSSSKQVSTFLPTAPTSGPLTSTPMKPS